MGDIILYLFRRQSNSIVVVVVYFTIRFIRNSYSNAQWSARGIESPPPHDNIIMNFNGISSLPVWCAYLSSFRYSPSLPLQFLPYFFLNDGVHRTFDSPTWCVFTSSPRHFIAAVGRASELPLNGTVSRCCLEDPKIIIFTTRISHTIHFYAPPPPSPLLLLPLRISPFHPTNHPSTLQQPQ